MSAALAHLLPAPLRAFAHNDTAAARLLAQKRVLRWSPLFGQFETFSKLHFASSDRFPVAFYLSNMLRPASSRYGLCEAV